MSTLWTPRGEVPVDRDPPSQRAGGASDGDPQVGAPADPLDEAQAINLEDLTPEERERAEQAIREMAEAREALLAAPAAVVVANHAMGLYELAALHLSQKEPNFSQATVAIDALGALLDGMAGRLGDPEPTLREGLDQIRMAYVALKQSAASKAGDGDAADTSDGDSKQ